MNTCPFNCGMSYCDCQEEDDPMITDDEIRECADQTDDHFGLVEVVYDVTQALLRRHPDLTPAQAEELEVRVDTMLRSPTAQFERALEKFRKAAFELAEAWQDDSVDPMILNVEDGTYPKWMPSFEEAMADIQWMQVKHG